jgi:hypothetical protein
MYAASVPMMPWPPAGMIAPPEPAEGESEEAAPTKKPLRASRGVQRVRPVASGPASAKLKQQRKR